MVRKIYGLTAQETIDTSGGHGRLEVSATIQTFNGGEQISLFEAMPQGINPEILIIQAQIDRKDAGTDVLGKVTVPFVRPVSANQFSKVMVTTDDNSASIDIEVV